MNKKLDKNNFFDISACLFSILNKLEKIEQKLNTRINFKAF